MKKFITLKYFRFGITQSVASLVPIKGGCQSGRKVAVTHNSKIDLPLDRDKLDKD